MTAPISQNFYSESFRDMLKEMRTKYPQANKECFDGMMYLGVYEKVLSKQQLK